MASESMFVEQDEQNVRIKKESPCSTFGSEDQLDRSTPVPVHSTKAPAAPLSHHTDYGPNSGMPSIPVDQVILSILVQTVCDY
jgi:hypothetical protein